MLIQQYYCQNKYQPINGYQQINYLQLMEQQLEFPSKTTFAYHKFLLTICWSLLANFSIFFVMYRYRIYGYYVHMILSWLIVAFTIAMTLLFLIPIGVQVNPQDSQLQQAHNVIGLLFLIFIFFQFLLGIFSRIFQQNYQIRSLLVLRTKTIHRVFGYLLVILGKYQVLVGWYNYYVKEGNVMFYVLVGWQGLWLILLVARKIGYFPSLERNVIYHQIQQQGRIRKISSIKEIQKGNNYIVFANFVFDITPLYNNHPAGYQVINAVKNREVDRFLYGMYSPEKVSEIGIHSHTYKSLSLLGSPIAKIDIPSTFADMKAINSCYLAYKINYNDRFYVAGFSAAYTQSFVFKGYQSLNQLGQYYAVNIGGTTRLYTVVNCLRTQNIEAIKKLTLNSVKKNKKKNDQKFIVLKTQQGRIETETIIEDPVYTSTNFNQQKKFNEITIMFKKYEKGALTPTLSKLKQQQLVNISRQRGIGMRLDQIQEGNIVFVAGGTGLNPFIDLIDLLFKSEVIKHENLNSIRFEKTNPILSDHKIFSSFDFTFLIAVDDIKDIHPLTLFQLHYLASQNPTFRCIMRIRNEQKSFREEFPGFNFIQQKFEGFLKTIIKQKNPVKFYICGPPIMNSAIIQFMEQQQIPSQKYMIM